LFYAESSRLLELEKLGPGTVATGHCHRYPPQVLLDRPDCFPEVRVEDYCGEFVYSPPDNEGKDEGKHHGV